MECFPFSRTPILRAQLTDDTHPINQTHATLVSFACRVGEELASRAKSKGIEGVAWPRKRGQRYHGRVAALITAMKDHGLPLI